ncbi:GNAT family N-acetyltransferase [Psychrobacter sp. JCM 18900]|uniref:GNAT family N-acetyltransferase n=1 Tax=Psychrobacter sp. JCM 18900 TaxID=1298608 RepID=UPI00191980A1|nr:GNAT family N-acetyltransferase [Psychrobacter sp. JCM 18900]
MINDALELILVNETDLDYLYNLQCIEGIRKFALDSNIPKYDDHIKWFNNKLKSDTTKIFKIVDNDIIIGVVRLDSLLDSTESIAEISLTIDPKYAGKGYAKRTINKIIKVTDLDAYHAVIHESNIASQKVFSANRFSYNSLYCPKFNLYIYRKG